MKGGEKNTSLFPDYYYLIGGLKMKQKRIFALTLILALLIGMFAIVPTAGAVSDRPVKLIYAVPIRTYPGYGAEGYIEIENIAYAKNVTVHYSFDGTTWEDCAATYYKPTWGNYEAWKFKTEGRTTGMKGSVEVKFSIKYEVNGQTYWDNNDGKNYSVEAGYGVTDRYDFGVGGVANLSTYRYNNKIDGYLELKDMGSNKDVKVIYTTNNWATSNVSIAEYDYTFAKNSSVQLWKYSYTSSASNIQYKLSYTVNGITYVDDNFGNYYTVGS